MPSDPSDPSDRPAPSAPAPADPTLAPFAIDPRALAALRVALAGIVLYDVLDRATEIDALLTDAGVLPRSKLFFYRIGEIDRVSLHALSGEAPWQAFLLGVTGCAALLFGVGIATRASGFVCWALVASMQFRNPLILNGGDIVLRLLLFWSMFLPLGLRGRPFRRGGTNDRAPVAAVRSVAGAALLGQVALIYLFAAAHKWVEPVWRSLAAFRQAMTVDGAATAFGQWLGSLPILPELGTAGVLLFESVGPLLVFAFWRSARARTIGVFVFIAFHLVGLATVFRFGLFPFVMAAGWLPFLPAPFWDAIERRVRGARRATNGATRRSPRIVNALVASLFAAVVWSNLGTLDAVTLVPGDEAGPHGPLRDPLHVVGLNQRWSLWSRPLVNRYYVLAARTRNGQDIDLRRNGAPLDFANPSLRSRDARWWKMEVGLARESATPLRGGYGCHAMHRWNATHPRGDDIDNVALWMVVGGREEVLAGRGQRQRLWQSVLYGAGGASIPPRFRCAPTD